MSVCGTVVLAISLENFLGRWLCIIYPDRSRNISALFGISIKASVRVFPRTLPKSTDVKSDNARYIFISVLPSLAKTVTEY